MNKNVTVGIVVGILVISGSFFYNGKGGVPAKTPLPAVTAVIDPITGKQIIDITAHGGYSPKVVGAKAGIPTIIRVTTKDTYDCSVSLVIPKLSYRKFLDSNGTEEINISADQAKGTLNGLCSMGMYSFKVMFQ